MPALAIGGAISAGSSLLGGILGHSAANSAGNTLAKAAGQASQSQLAAGQQAQGDISGEINKAGTTLAPYTSLGSNAAGQLNNALGNLTQGYGQTFNAPTAAQAAATPGEQFQMQQGLNALQNSAAARGGLLSSGTAKNLLGYSQGLASTTYQNAFQNALQGFNTNENTYYQNQANAYNRLSGATQLGQNAAESQNSTQAGLTNSLANSITGNQQVANQDLLGGAQAQAAATIGGTNALTSGLAGAGSALGQGISLQGILGAQNASNSGNTSGGFYGGNPYAGAGQNSSFIGGLGSSTYDPYSNALQGPS